MEKIKTIIYLVIDFIEWKYHLWRNDWHEAIPKMTTEEIAKNFDGVNDRIDVYKDGELVGDWVQVKLVGIYNHTLSDEEILSIYNAYTRKPWYKRLWQWISQHLKNR